MHIDQATYQSLGFNAYFIDHLRNHNPQHVLGFRCEPPQLVFDSPLIEKNIFPLWECGLTLAYFMRDTHRFEICHLEEVATVWESFPSIQGLFAYLLLQLWEDEKSEAEISEIGNAIGFNYLSKLLEEADSAADYTAWKDEFLKQCT